MGFTAGTFDAQAPYLIDSVAQLSSSQLLIEHAEEWDNSQKDAEQQIIKAVAAGNLDLGLVGTRSLTAMGVTDFDALSAPMLIDSYALERAVLDSDIPAQMLLALDQLEVSGLAVIGGGLRFPSGVDAPFLGPETYSGQTFHVFPSEIGTATIAALGATATDAIPADRDVGLSDGSINGFENSMSFLAGKPAFARHVTLNAPFWPATGILVASPATMAELDDQQTEWLTTAASDTAARALDLLADDQDSLQSICDQGGAVYQASDSELAALGETVQPVYQQLTSDPDTAAYIDQIKDIKQSVQGQALVIPEGCGEAVGGSDSRLPDGTYRTNVLTVDDIVGAMQARGIDQDLIDSAASALADDSYMITFKFEAGSFVQLETQGGHEEVGSSGTYRVIDDTHIEFNESCCGTTPLQFSLDGDTLTLHLDFPDEDIQAYCQDQPTDCFAVLRVIEAGRFVRDE